MSKYSYLLGVIQQLPVGTVVHRMYGVIPDIVTAKDVFRESEDGHLTIINPSKPYKPAY